VKPWSAPPTLLASYAAAVTTWITQRAAAGILGVHKSRVAKLVAEGTLASRGGRTASLNRTEVIALAGWRAEAPQRARVERERRAAEREAARTHRRPPDLEHDWLSTADVARLLGVSRTAVLKRINADRLPHVMHGGQHWVRRDLLELAERAREARRTRAVVTSQGPSGGDAASSGNSRASRP
jgi:excisionase family DNA binding protein